MATNNFLNLEIKQFISAFVAKIRQHPVKKSLPFALSNNRIYLYPSVTFFILQFFNFLELFHILKLVFYKFY
ncbi:hypothetical protein CW752_06625 [Chryseobacterium sp. PMSZPI]|nr:hypothetical protein CW752_06625 [Chryseobacterium sp. PMSZPI]